jgi:transposase
MDIVATRPENFAAQVLYVALELGEKKWKLAFAVGPGQAPRLRQVNARDLDGLHGEIGAAAARLHLPADVLVRSCYEAGRDGFWLHRALLARGIVNSVVDSSSIEVDRRARRMKSDGLDAVKLVSMLMRFDRGEVRVWRVVRVPSVAEEDQRQLHRELAVLKSDRTRLVNRVKSLLVTQGIASSARGALPRQVETLKLWNGERLPDELMQRLKRECERVDVLDQAIRSLERRRKERVRNGSGRALGIVRKLLKLRGIGIESAWIYTMELFSWREIRNVRQVGALAGLVAAPYQSGEMNHVLGITKAGNRFVRAIAVEIAWGWLQHQPDSELAQWYRSRFGGGGSAQRRKGIVALARKLLVALWKYVERGEVPAGALVKA